MALSQDEQRMLAEIERRLATDDPGLASCLTTFRRPGPGTVLRSPRARIVGSLFTVLLVAMVSLMVYAMVPFRAHSLRHAPPQASSAPVNTAISAVTSSEPNSAQQSSASTGVSTQQSSTSTSAKSTTSQSAQTRSAPAAATGKAQQAKVEPTNVPLLPDTSP
jgi:cytoskeletal protein RodZ